MTATVTGSPCRHCGDDRRPDTTCSRCGGAGLVADIYSINDCPTCWGSGIIWPPVCRGCAKFRSMKGWEHD